jgi:UDP-2,4-diacetamido-2,4,6-trideoxy-beta-L-altropyranose hydrolase
VTFICREHQGNLIERVRASGFQCYALPLVTTEYDTDSDVYHSSWLGVSQQQDAQACEPILLNIMPDWLIVDHYAIDYRWQDALQGYYCKLMVIDDLADRVQRADILLNQNYGAMRENYQPLVSSACVLLLGLEFALLRKEFFDYRAFRLDKKPNDAIQESKRLLITMGGVDENNITSQVLRCFDDALRLINWSIVVVVGEKYPYLATLTQQIESMPNRIIDLLVGINNMAEVMANCDLAIGAAGATTWERCCLGLPSIQLVIAYNQQDTAQKLARDGVVLMAQSVEDVGYLLDKITIAQLQKLSDISSRLCDGLGAERVKKILFNEKVTDDGN